ncbi:C-type lectin domain family 2 member B-like [Pseudonaja textilis]|uniref:C-type lectin domain family 2 member B-like n=1 Tax=Pseudonaja textilis TaxID=8673 RepID=UPI000EAACE23|nr:C-type lectin domain family 2 member B-like [Pseudonaja textilis]
MASSHRSAASSMRLQGSRNRINIEIGNINKEQELQHPSPHGNARGQEEESEPRSYSKKKIVIIGIAIATFLVILLSIVIALVRSNTTENQKTEAVQTGTSVPLNYQQNVFYCPPDWYGHNKSCYKLSEEEKNWNESKNSCFLHNATLAKITEEEIVTNGIIRMFTKVHVFWIGLTREPNQHWKWLDGENATMEVKGNGGDCAFLDDEVTAMSVRCSTEHYYVCKKPMLSKILKENWNS